MAPAQIILLCRMAYQIGHWPDELAWTRGKRLYETEDLILGKNHARIIGVLDLLNPYLLRRDDIGDLESLKETMERTGIIK